MITQNRNCPQTETKGCTKPTLCSTTLTTIKKKKENIELNEESVSPCTCKKLYTVSLTPEVIREKITQILYESNTSSSQLLLKCLEGWIGMEWKQHRLKILNRISKLKYLHPSLMGENYTQIEREILIEWRKNTFLRGCQLLWNHVFRSSKFKNLQELNQFYQTIKELIAHISYILFEPPLEALRKRGISVENRLLNITSVTVVTASKQWKLIAQRVIKSLLLERSPSFSENFDLQSLKVSPEIIDFNNRNGIFQKTAISLATLNSTYNLPEIVGTLKAYRQSMIDDIKANIDNWSTRNGKASCIILEKDDILACLIYSLVAYKLDEVGLALQYIRFLLGNELQTILREAKVDCYLTDLQGVIQYLTTPVIEVSLKQMETQETKEEMISV